MNPTPAPDDGFTLIEILIAIAAMAPTTGSGSPSQARSSRVPVDAAVDTSSGDRCAVVIRGARASARSVPRFLSARRTGRWWPR